MAAPEKLTIDTPEQIALEFTLASVGSRFLALGIDTLIQGVAFATLAGLAVLAIAVLPPVAASLRPWIGGALVLGVFTIYYGYFAVFETVWRGQTPGKRFIGLRAINVSGRPLTAFEAILRNIVRIADQLPGVYAVGILAVLVTERSQRLGDLAAGSVVVHESRTEGPAIEAAPASTTARYGAARLSTGEIALIETFLRRRKELEGQRELRAGQIAQRVRARLGLDRDGDDERFLEEVMAEYRATGGYR